MNRDSIVSRVLLVVVAVLFLAVLFLAVQLDNGQSIGGIVPDAKEQTEEMSQETEEDTTLPMETEEIVEATEATESTDPTEDTEPEKAEPTEAPATNKKPGQNSGATGNKTESTTPPETEAPATPPATEAPTTPPETQAPDTPSTEGSDEESVDKIEGDMGVEDSIF